MGGAAAALSIVMCAVNLCKTGSSPELELMAKKRIKTKTNIGKPVTPLPKSFSRPSVRPPFNRCRPLFVYFHSILHHLHRPMHSLFNGSMGETTDRPIKRKNT